MLRSFSIVLLSILLCACGGTEPGGTTTATADTEMASSVTSTIEPANGKEANCDNAAANEKIRTAMSLEVLEGMTKEEARNWKPCNNCEGLTDQNIDTTYNDHCVLCLERAVQYMGAYPSGLVRWHCFDRNTGKQLTAADVFVTEKMDELARKCDERLNRIIEEGKKDLPAEELEYYLGELEDHKPFAKKDLDKFYFDATGVTFAYDLSFRHVVQNLQPVSDIKWTMAEIRTYLRADGQLAFMLK